MKLHEITGHALGIALAASLLALPGAVAAAGHRGQATSHHTSRYATGVPRDKHGRIARSAKAERAFRKDHPCPATGKASGACTGYVIDHIKPLKRGGADRPDNMQWQTREAAKIKDRTE